jgi:hypothetical protein
MTNKHTQELNGFLKATIALRRRLRKKVGKEEGDAAPSLNGNAYQRKERAVVTSPKPKIIKKETIRKPSRKNSARSGG